MTDSSLVRWTPAEEIQLAREFVRANAGERRRQAARAVAERDHEALWLVTRAYLTAHQRSGNTISSYRKGVMVLLDAWQGVDLLRPTRADAEAFVLSLVDPEREADPDDPQMVGQRRVGQQPPKRPLSPASVRQRVAAARAFYEALRWTEITAADPFADVAMPKLTQKAAQRTKEKAYTLDELEWMARVTQDWDDRLILLLGAHAGLRVSEMLALTWGDVDLRQGTLTVRLGKGGQTGQVTMSDELKRNLTARVQDVDAGSPGQRVLIVSSRAGVYNRVEKLWNRSFEMQGYDLSATPPFTKGVHGLRHFAGVHYASQTSDLRKVRDHLRHSSMSTSEIYMAAAQDTDEVREWSIGLDEM